MSCPDGQGHHEARHTTVLRSFPPVRPVSPARDRQAAKERPAPERSRSRVTGRRHVIIRAPGQKAE